MDLFGEQIEERKRADQRALEESFESVAKVALGERITERITDRQIDTRQALDEIFRYYHKKPVEVPESVSNAEAEMDYCLRHYGFLSRDIELSDKWYDDAFGPIMGFKKDDGTPVALLPHVIHGYYYKDKATGKHITINKKNVRLFELEALCFYRPLPLRPIGIPDLLAYLGQSISISDYGFVILTTLIVTTLGLLIPKLTAAVTGPILHGRDTGALLGAAVFIMCITLSTQLLSMANNMLKQRLSAKTSLAVQSSMMMRLLSMPVSFFGGYSPGELQSRQTSVNELSTMIMNMVMQTGLTALSSLLYVTQIFNFAPSLVVPSVIIVILTTAFSIITTLAETDISRQRRDLSAKESGLSYQLITGVQKIRLSGSEKRLFARWLSLYSKGLALTYNPPLFIKLSSVISKGIGMFATIIMYYLAIESGIEQSSYFAFTAAYGSLMGAFSGLSGIALNAAKIKPVLEMAEPFLKIEPESSTKREIVTGISGAVELAHVSFRYEENSPLIIDDLSLAIRPGDYVAIVGKTGCGKSTLIRLLLGFETPEKGAIYYDGRDISTLDLGSLRKNIGTVTQDGGLFAGDIYQNISITAPHLTMDEAWEAAEIAGIAEDIREMPMGMFTMISEGSGGVSGGQKQRLMIARAVAPKPKLLIFDEATSAMDNKTQKKVSEALDKMGCTRIVVAHRLSTIRHCDRIVVIDGGHIVEDGTYEELIAQNGFFAELVERQRLDR